MASKNIPITLQQYDGDFKFTDYFFDQIENLQKIYKWSDELTIQFMRGKLIGPALTYFTENKNIYLSKDLNFIRKEFKSFFSPPSDSLASIELSNLAMLPQENVKHFSHRLNKLTAAVFKNIKDETALDALRLDKLRTALPPNLRTKLYEEGVDDYKSAVERAQKLQEISINEHLLNTISQQPPDPVVQRLDELTQKINTLSFASKPQETTHDDDNAIKHSKGLNKFSPKQHNKFFKNKRNNYRPHPYRNQNQITCQLCNRKNHTATQCFKWQRVNTRKSNFNERRFQKN